MLHPRSECRPGRWALGWASGIATALLVATVPPLIWFWLGIDREGRPIKGTDPPTREPQAGELLQPGSVWSGTMEILGKERNVKDMRLVIQKREGNDFSAETHFNRDKQVYEVEGQIDQNAISWKHSKRVQGKVTKAAVKGGGFVGTIAEDRIEVSQTGLKEIAIKVRLRLDKGS